MTIGTVLGLLLVGILAGSVAATLGVGGGIIYVPVLVALFGLAQHEAEGTSLIVIVPGAIVAAVVHGRAGRVHWRAALVLSSGAILGGYLGAEAALAVHPDVLQRMFGVLVAVSALRMLRKTRKSAHAP